MQETYTQGLSYNLIKKRLKEMSRGISYMRSQLSNKEPDPNYPLCLMYTHNRGNAEPLAKSLEKDGYDIPEDRTVNIGATIGTHMGTNCCGVAYIRR